MPRVGVGAALQHFRTPAIADAIVGIVVEQDLRHGAGARLADGEAVGLRAFIEASAQLVAHGVEAFEIVRLTDQFQRGEAGGHGGGGEPV